MSNLITSTDNVPLAFSMWQIFHNTIIKMFKNLDTAENNLRSLAENTILNSKEFVDMFIPRYDGTIALQENIRIERQYEAFTVWLLGRLFYVLSCSKLEGIHHLFIEAQLEILDVLQVNQPHIHFKMVTEYGAALATICDSHDSLIDGDNSVCLHCFVPDNTVINREELDLGPEFIRIDSESTRASLEKYVLEILCTAIYMLVSTRWMDKHMVGILDNFMKCLDKSKPECKVIIINFFVRLIDHISYKFSDCLKLQDYFIKALTFTEQLAYHYSSNISYFTITEVEHFEASLSNLFNVLYKKELISNTRIRAKCTQICNFLISQALKQKHFDNLSKNEFLISVCKLLRKILEFENNKYGNIDSLVDYALHKNISSFSYILIDYQILEQVKHYLKVNENSFDTSINPPIEIAVASETWAKVYNKCDSLLDYCISRPITLLNVNEILITVKQVCKMACKLHFSILDWCYFHLKTNVNLNFVKITPLLIKFRQLKEKYDININKDSLNLLDEMIESFGYLIPTLNIAQHNVALFQEMIFYICYPFIGEVTFPCVDSALCTSLINDISDGDLLKDRQMRCLRMLSTCMNACAEYEWSHFACVRQWIKNILNYCSTNSDVHIVQELIEQLPYFISSWKDEDIVTEVLLPLLKSNNTEIYKILMKNFSQVICLILGNTEMVQIVDINENSGSIYYQIYCLHCDSELCIKNKQKHKLLPIYNVPFKVQETYTSMIILKLLTSEDVGVKRNIVKHLPRLAKHTDKFQTEDVTKDWLKMVTDEDIETRRILSRVIAKTMQNTQNKEHISPEVRKLILKMCLQSLIDSTLKYFVQIKNIDMQQTTLEFIREIGLLKGDEIIYKTGRLLIIYLILCNSHLSLMAFGIFQQIAKKHNLTPNRIYTKFKKQYCSTMAGMSTYNCAKNKINLTTSLKRVLQVFQFTTKEFLSRDGHHFLPYLLPSFITMPACRPILNDMANLLMAEPGEILANNFAYIFPYVYLNEEPQVFKECVKFIIEVTKTSEASLRKRSLQVIYNELLMNFHDKRELVLKAIYDLSKDNSEMSVISSRKSLQEIADDLNPRFLGVLVYFDSKLVSKRICEQVKTNVLLSLPEILKLMGIKYITPLRYKVLATLRTALTLTDDPYPSLNCNAWEAFVQCCDPETLGPLLSTIFISLLPLMRTYPQKINAVFRYLLIENQDKVKDNLQDLFFLQDTEVDNEFKNIVRRHLDATRPNSFLDQLAVYLKFITHENTEVRIYGLKFLKRMLTEKRLELNEIVLGSNGMSEIIAELIDILITGCRESDEQIKLACGDCIGELGAIEPSHFPRKYTLTASNFTFYITDDAFIKNALLELIRAFQMEKHSQNMNRYALAIQEILKEFGVSSEENAPKHLLWQQFPEHIQELMLPLLSSRYTVAITSDKDISTHPIYGSNLGSSFKDWLYNWTQFLISLIKNDKQPLLQVCKPSLKQDYRTLMFFLPHILIHSILESNDAEKTFIYNEFVAVLNSSNNRPKLDETQTKYRPLKSECFTTVNVDVYPEENGQSKYMKVIFVLLDYLDRWLREWESNSKPRQMPSPIANEHYQAIKNFMGLFCNLSIAKCNYIREEYPRALLYLEKYVSGDKIKLNQQLGFFVKIYAELEEPDGVAGAMAMQQTEPSLEDTIVAHGVTGQFQDMAACYERMAQERTLKPEYLREMIRCYLELDSPYTAFNIAQGAIETHPDYKTMLYEAQVESFWRLSRFDELTELIATPELKNNTSWGVSVGKALQNFRLGNRPEFHIEINNIHKTLTEMLTVTSIEEGVYRHGYSHVIKLHILNELQKAEEMLYKVKDLDDKKKCEEAIDKLIEEWDFRLKIIQPSVRVYEPVLRLRRIVLEQSQVQLKNSNIQDVLNKHIAKYWLKSAEIARKAGNFQQAYIYILKAEKYKPMELFVEKAKLYWAKEEQELAFGTLKRGLEEHFPDAASFKDMNPLVRKTDRKLCAEAKLLIATYNDETANVGIEMNISNYKEAVDNYKEWEKSLVCLAQYYDKIFSNMSDEEKDVKGGEIQVHIINCFGKSLQYGSCYLYQSMPRMLSIWFDYGTRILEAKNMDARKNTLFKMIKLMDTYLDRLPAYMFLSAFSQLVSRICHPVREVYLQIKSILIKLILKYPQQSMWMLLAVSKSGYAMRTKRCQEMLQDQRLKNSKTMKLIYDFNRLAEKLIELCNKQLTDGITHTSVSAIIRSLPRLLQNNDFSQIILPIQKLRRMVLPNPDFTNSQHEPFPNAFIYIVGIEDEMTVLQSLQRPRKITFRGSDGNRYDHMLKPKDDLRKDSRLMEFNDVVNLYLHKEAESRERRLYIRTYSVVPLNEECGIVEWVDNLVGLRPVLINMYKQKGLYVGARELKTMMCNLKDTPAKKRQVFEEKLLPRHPAILSDWFRRMFPDAHHWYQARTAYIRTCAVISMVGYMLGLGDRHGENILLDSTNGDVVHVDFNCLFNKGENFDWPERVPFRLTHNMVEAMGPLGVDGIFRKSCAVTLRVLRIHTDTLMSIVKPFVYDPLVSWPRNAVVKTDQSEAERTNEQAVEHIRNIELRLQGSYKSRGKSYSVALSCEGQANNLISEATNIDYLSQMYIGWGPFL